MITCIASLHHFVTEDASIVGNEKHRIVTSRTVRRAVLASPASSLTRQSLEREFLVVPSHRDAAIVPQLSEERSIAGKAFVFSEASHAQRVAGLTQSV
jgi:hypothetical protein